MNNLLNIKTVSNEDLDNILFENKIAIVGKLGKFLKSESMKNYLI